VGLWLQTAQEFHIHLTVDCDEQWGKVGNIELKRRMGLIIISTLDRCCEEYQIIDIVDIMLLVHTKIPIRCKYVWCFSAITATNM
jgi:hypothetical protein